MGKLLQKVVHGILPSWLTKVKSSSQSSPKKLLPFFRTGGNHRSSHTSPSSPPTTTPVPALVDNSTAPQDASSSLAIPPPPALVDKNNTQVDESTSIAILPSSSSVQRKESVSEKSLEKSDVDGRHQHEECHVSEDMKVYNYHRTFRDMLEDDILSTVQSDRRNTKLAAEHYAHSSEECLKMQGLIQHTEENIHHSQDGVVQEAQYDSGYQEMLGLKRKRRSPIFEANENGEGVGRGAGSDGIKRRAWKRRKREKGVTSCELPESICRITGNGRAVVKQSVEPHLALWESMVEMIVGNGLWEQGNLEFLLYCYLSLNEPHLHPIIQSSFLQVLKDLERIS